MRLTSDDYFPINMNAKDAIQYSVLFIVLVLAQVLICNHLNLFNLAIPIVFIYFIIRLPINMKLGLLFSLAFLIGLTVDVFSDTAGVNALACTLLAAIKRPAFYAYVPRDDKTKSMVPSAAGLGLGIFSKYLLTLVTIYCLLAFTIEYFNFSDVKEVVIKALASSVLSFLIILGIDSLVFSKG